MTQEIRVCFLPPMLVPDDLDGACVVMTDVIRASSSIATALANGASRIIPQAEIEDSFALAKKLGDGTLVGGERGGKIVPGFNAGNSPREYTEEKIRDNTLVLCTSNGTWALEFCRGADRILSGAIVNLSETANVCNSHDKVTVVCAGTDRHITGEDVLFAGGVVSKLREKNSRAVLSDQAQIALAHWERVEALIESGETTRYEVFQNFRGAIPLLGYGYHADVEYCSKLDLLSVACELDQENWTINLVE